MKPAITSGYFRELDIYEMPKVFIETGYWQTDFDEDRVELFMTGAENSKEYRKYIDDLGFSIPQGHLIYMNAGNITSYDNTYAIDNLKKNLDIFYDLGVKAAVLHYSNFGTDVVPIEEWFDVRVDALNQLTEYIKGTDMVLCLENLSRIHDFDAGHLLKMCKSVTNQQNIGICLDTGHLNISHFGNQYDFIKQAGHYLKAMHVHDNRGEQNGLAGIKCDWHIMPFCGGNIKWEDVKRGVAETNYQGVFAYEVGCNAPLEIKKLQARYLLDCYNNYFAF